MFTPTYNRMSILGISSSSGDIDNAMLELLLSFCSNQFVELAGVMSLLGELEGAVAALQSAHRIVQLSNLN